MLWRRLRVVLRRSVTFAIWSIVCWVAYERAADADNSTSTPALLAFLEEDLGTTPDEIAKLLTRYAGRQDPDVEPHLARWASSQLTVAILETGYARPDVQDLIAGLNDVAFRTNRHISFCIQPLSVNSDGTYVPRLNDVDCLRQQSDVLLVVDNSPLPSRPLYRDLLLRATLPEDVAFWEARADADGTLFQQTGCEERMRLDKVSWVYSSATAYVRIVDRGVSYRSCIRALPYLIFGQLPVKRPNGRQDLIPELLELRYSPDLSAGMTLEEIKASLAR